MPRIMYTDGTFTTYRKSLRPGQVFVNPHRWRDETTYGDLLVVLDGRLEVGFWEGCLWAFGDVEPEALVRVIS